MSGPATKHVSGSPCPLHLLEGLLHDALRPLLAEIQRLGRVADVSCVDQHAQRQRTLVVRPVRKVCWQQLAGRNKVLHKEQSTVPVSYSRCTSMITMTSCRTGSQHYLAAAHWTHPSPACTKCSQHTKPCRQAMSTLAADRMLSPG